MLYRNEIKGNNSIVFIQHDMEFNYSHLIKEISRYLSEPAIETKKDIL
jgi:ABC-type uncharacterized transport system ATPase subunit